MRRRLLWGALAGALGGLAMKAVVRFVDGSSFGLSSKTDAKTAHEIWRRMGRQPINERTAANIGAGMHYGFAVIAGAVYAASAAKFPFVRIGAGTGFGAALWLVGDEVAVSAAGLEDPFGTSISSHVSALGAHLIYGLIVDAVSSEARSAVR